MTRNTFAQIHLQKDGGVSTPSLQKWAQSYLEARKNVGSYTLYNLTIKKNCFLDVHYNGVGGKFLQIAFGVMGLKVQAAPLWRPGAGGPTGATLGSFSPSLVSPQPGFPRYHHDPEKHLANAPDFFAGRRRAQAVKIQFVSGLSNTPTRQHHLVSKKGEERRLRLGDPHRRSPHCLFTLPPQAVGSPPTLHLRSLENYCFPLISHFRFIWNATVILNSQPLANQNSGPSWVCPPVSPPFSFHVRLLPACYASRGYAHIAARSGMIQRCDGRLVLVLQKRIKGGLRSRALTPDSTCLRHHFT